MPKRRHRFQAPPAQDPLHGARSSLVFRLNFGFFFRQLGIFFVMDLLLVIMATTGLFLWAENRCADVVALVDVRGVPTADAIPWMEASDYSITPLDREPQGVPVPFDWLRIRRETADALHQYDLMQYYSVELKSAGQPYAVTVDLTGVSGALCWAGAVLLICQGLSLLTNLFRNNRSIHKVLKPIQDLAATAARLNSMTHMSRQQLEALAGELEKINAKHLDSRIDLPATQKELRALAQAINAMLDRIDQSYRAQMRFVSDASHELRTPISVIQGYANLLNRWGKDDPEAMQESIDAITQEAQSMKELVEQLLFLARGDNDSLVVEPEVFDLTAVAGQVMRDSQVIDQTHPMEAHWEGPVFVNCDLGLTKQAIRILVDNAIKYTPNGGAITMTVEEKEGMAHLSVTDEGIGISPEALPHIFDRFFRADESRTRQTGGSGLGLSIAKWIVERHGGWFDVVSRQNVGTKMTIVLPTVPMPAAPDGSEAVETNHLEIR